MQNLDKPQPIKFRFRNVGPVEDAALELGDLTVIAGRNNTGKTYIVYSLYGFLKMWRGFLETRIGRLHFSDGGSFSIEHDGSNAS